MVPRGQLVLLLQKRWSGFHEKILLHGDSGSATLRIFGSRGRPNQMHQLNCSSNLQPHGLTIGRRCRDCLKVVRDCRPSVFASSASRSLLDCGTALRPVGYGPQARPGRRSRPKRGTANDCGRSGTGRERLPSDLPRRLHRMRTTQGTIAVDGSLREYRFNRLD
jgi:hypothetical protein